MTNWKRHFILASVLFCGLTPAASSQGIYWTQGTYGSAKVRRATSSGAIIDDIVAAGNASSLPSGVAIDTINDRVYWVGAPYAGANVYRSNPDLTGDDSVSGNASAFRDIALDVNAGKMYWTSTNLVQGPRIYSANLDGTGMTVLIDFYALHDSATTPRGIALDTVDQKLYWASDATGAIQRSNLDGSAIETVQSGLTTPVGIALDMTHDKIYWTQCANPGGTIRRADLTNSGSTIANITDLVTNVASPYAIALDPVFSKIYWTELGGSTTSPRIARANLDGTSSEVVVDNIAEPYGLAVEITSSPLLTVNSASTVTTNSATLSGTVIPNGTSTHVQFRYGTSSSYGNSTGIDTLDDPETALSFNGTSAYVNAGNPTSFNFVGPFSIEAWFKVTSFSSGWEAIVTKGDGAWRVQRYNGTDNLDFGTNGLSNQDLQGSTNVNDGNWHHVAAVYDGSNKLLYVDGKLDASAAVTGTLSTDTYALYFGENAQMTGRYFDGFIDEVRVWNAALDSSTIRDWMDRNIAKNHPYYSSLAGYWQFNEGSGSTAYDSSGNGNDGTLVNSPVWTDGTRAFSVSADVSGLSPSTTYHYSLEATNASGTAAMPDSLFTTAAPLPVQLASITATGRGLTAVLHWQTVTEVNNYGFRVERKEMRNEISNLNHDNSWIPVGIVKGNGSSNAPHEYTFIDKGLSPGLYSYRIKQTDQSGSFTYSKEVQVEVGMAPRLFALSQNYPNPFNPTTTIEFTLEHDGHVSLNVYDILGRQVATLLDENRKAGEYQQAVFDASRYASGVYFAVLRSGGKTMLKKMLLVK